MIKYLEVPDFHFNPAWAKVSIKVGAAILKAAIDNNVDFIAFVGDGHDKPIMATDKGGINTLRAIIKPLVNYCPVVAIEGTPSHDGPGCYGLWEDLGVIVLKPNHTYGYMAQSSLLNSYVEDLSVSNNLTPQCILFGVPELSKKHVQAQLGLSAENATRTTLECFKDYIESYIAPMRYKYNDIPAFGLLHGNVSDSKQENQTDTILRASDLVIYTDDLRPANLTRWSLGHIHTPWESKVINAGYAGFTGMDSSPYGKLNFVPAMNLVNELGNITRIPYGTPMRVKITEPLADAQYDKNVAYWLFTKDPKATLPMELVHEWSRTTYNEVTATTRRVTEEEAESAKTLSDFLTLLNPDATVKQKEYIDTIPVYTPKTKLDVNVKLESVEVRGCKLFNSKTVKFDLTTLPNTVTEIVGDNGAGKSSLLAMLSPYPIIVGKDTQNRDSAIGEFFTEKDSSIHKVFTVNGQVHDHLINIKGAHTKTSKNECYLTIDGVPKLDKGSFDEMMAMCEQLYGSFIDYVLTSFYVQPLQSKKLSSGLMDANMKNVQCLVQNIAGIDRSKEKAYALAQALELDGKVVELENQIKGSEDNLEDIEALHNHGEELEQDKLSAEKELQLMALSGAGLKGNYEALQLKKAANDVLIAQQVEDGKKQTNLSAEIFVKESSIEDVKELAGQAGYIRQQIEASNNAYASNNSRNAIIAKNDALTAEYTKTKGELENRLQVANFEYQQKCKNIDAQNSDTVRKYELQKCDFVKEYKAIEYQNVVANQEWQADCVTINRDNSDAQFKHDQSKQGYESSIADNNKSIEAYQHQIDIAYKPCSKCGHLEETLQQTVTQNNAYINGAKLAIESFKKRLLELQVPVDKVLPSKPIDAILPVNTLVEPELLVKPVKPVEITDTEMLLHNLVIPTYLAVPSMQQVLTDTELQELQTKLSDINIGNSRIAEYQAQIEAIKAQIIALQSKTYNIDYQLDGHIGNIAVELEQARVDYGNQSKSIATINANICNNSEQIERYNKQMSAISAKKDTLAAIVDDYKTWDYVARMLNPNKIPAMELELMLSSIDAEATRIISGYDDSRFIFETKTQNENGTDKFDILVYDSSNGDKRSFMKFSVGQKAFLADAYTKSLVRQRNTNGTRVYSPVVMDESDGPVDPGRVGDYYNVQKNYWNTPVLVVSHNPASQEFIDSRVDMEELID